MMGAKSTRQPNLISLLVISKIYCLYIKNMNTNIVLFSTNTNKDIVRLKWECIILLACVCIKIYCNFSIIGPLSRLVGIRIADLRFLFLKALACLS